MSAHMFFAAAAAEPRAAGDQPRVRRRRRQGHGQESRRPLRVGGRAGQGGRRGGARTARARRAGRSDRTADHPAVRRVRPEAEPDGLRAQPPPAPRVPVKRSRFSRTQMALLAGTVAMFALAAVLAAVVVFTGGGGGSAPQTPLAAPPPSTTTVTTTAPSPSEESSHRPPRRRTSPSPTAAVAGLSDVDAQGFVGHAARCDAGSTLAAAIRTASSLAIVCETAPGSYYYHGERLSDGANLQMANATPVGGGFDATNPADGARYQVRPDELTISSNGHVDSAEAALEYGAD